MRMPKQDVDKKLDLDVLPPTRRIVVTTYDLAQKLRGYEGHFGALIADESHALKNPTSKRTQVHLFGFLRSSPHDM